MWKRSVRIHFTREDGATLSVSVNPKFTRWHENKGDWPLAPGFGEFIQQVFGPHSS